jgi:hypothetical protein
MCPELYREGELWSSHLAPIESFCSQPWFPTQALAARYKAAQRRLKTTIYDRIYLYKPFFFHLMPRFYGSGDEYHTAKTPGKIFPFRLGGSDE